MRETVRSKLDYVRDQLQRADEFASADNFNAFLDACDRAQEALADAMNEYASLVTDEFEPIPVNDAPCEGAYLRTE